MPHEHRLLLSIEDAATALAIGRSKAYQLMSEGRLLTVHIGRRRLVRIDREAIANGEPALIDTNTKMASEAVAAAPKALDVPAAIVAPRIGAGIAVMTVAYFAEVAVAHDVTARQVALAFLTHRAFVIPKASTPEHAAENAGAGDLKLYESELARIEAAFPRGPGPAVLPML